MLRVFMVLNAGIRMRSAPAVRAAQGMRMGRRTRDVPVWLLPVGLTRVVRRRAVAKDMISP